MPRKPLALPQPFVIRRSTVQGRGCFATRDIKRGVRIAEYEGERISWKEADRRYDDDGMRRHHTFLFSVTSRTVIDGAVNGSDARFINHSCDPNCEAVDDGGRIFIEARRRIAAGEELCYDYAYARDESTTEADERLYACRCGTAKCRGTILEPPRRSRSLPRAHHAAARHPQQHVGASSRRTSSGKTSSAAPGSRDNAGRTGRGHTRATRTDAGAGATRGGGRAGARRGTGRA